MNIEGMRGYCIAKYDVFGEPPCCPDVLVFKVSGKIFALTNIENYVSVNLKCDPERTLDLREEHASVTPGYHMNKTHWNTVEVAGDVSRNLLKELIDHSYNLVVNGLSKRKRDAIIAANSADN